MMKKFLLTFFLLCAAGGAAQAQTPEAAISAARERYSDIKNRSNEMERMKREANKRTVGENFTLNFPAIKEDFEKIQKLNDSLFKLNAAETPPANSSVLKLVAEIHRRAARLNSNLFPTEAEAEKTAKNKQPDGESREIKTLLAVLDKSVNSFVHSSVFQNINLVNTTDSLKAQKDLETVISVSGALKAKTKN